MAKLGGSGRRSPLWRLRKRYVMVAKVLVLLLIAGCTTPSWLPPDCPSEHCDEWGRSVELEQDELVRYTNCVEDVIDPKVMTCRRVGTEFYREFRCEHDRCETSGAGQHPTIFVEETP